MNKEQQISTKRLATLAGATDRVVRQDDGSFHVYYDGVVILSVDKNGKVTYSSSADSLIYRIEELCGLIPFGAIRVDNGNGTCRYIKENNEQVIDNY